MKRIIYPLLLPVLFLLASAGCARQEQAPAVPDATDRQHAQTAQITEIQPQTEMQTAPPEEDGGINPLTGETGYPESAAGKRPVAVMVNNIAQAYPQYGIIDADVLFEVPVEGGVTRMMAVFANQDAVPDVGSVRSCRYYFPKLAMGMDAIYCHWGAEQFHAVSLMEHLDIDHFDGTDLEHSILFYRDPERVGKYSSEHTGYLHGADIPAVLEMFGTRRYAVSRKPMFTFRQTPETPKESACVRAEVTFTHSSRTGFVYDPETQTYLVEHNGSPQMDGHAAAQIAFRNIFILQTEMGYLDEAKYLRKVELEGGNGYYVSLGGVESIRWEKGGDRSRILFYDANGEPLAINTGSSYIGFIDSTGRTQFYAE